MRLNTDRIFYYALIKVLSFISIIWLSFGTERLLQKDFAQFGIFPRRLDGFSGIFLSPLIHADFYHLLSNTFPLLFLGLAIFSFYRKISSKLMLLLYSLSGLLVWVFGRASFHIGASGLIYSMMGFLLVSGLIRKDSQSGGIALAFLFLYGGILQGIAPAFVKSNVSWESHMLGLIVGTGLAIWFRNAEGPEQPENREEEEDESTINFSEGGEYQYVYKKDLIINPPDHHSFACTP